MRLLSVCLCCLLHFFLFSMCDNNEIKRPFLGPNELPADKLVCDKCQVTFKQRKNLYAHIRKIHGESIGENGNKVCALCLSKLRTMSLLHTHLTEKHDIRLDFSEFTFYHYDDFQEWKHKIEKDSSSCFILKSGIGKGEGRKFCYYDCHRSLKIKGGYQKPLEKRKRRMKASGSIKSEYTCPAMINVHTQTINEVTEIRVRYQSLHLGHTLDVGKLPLTGEVRAILDQTLKNYSPTRQFGLTTRKDLHNITNSFNIKRRKEDLLIYINECRHIEKEIIATTLNKNVSNDTLEKMKQKLKDSLPQLMKKIDEVNSVDVMKSVQEHFNAINSYLDFKSLNNELIPVKEITSAPNNKNIDPQRKFVIKKNHQRNLVVKQGLFM